VNKKQSPRSSSVRVLEKGKSPSDAKQTKTTRGRKVSPDEFSKQVRAAAERVSNVPGMSRLTALSENTISSPVLLIGTQHVRIKRTIEWIKETLFSTNSSSFSSYFGTELTTESSLGHIRGALTNLSLFSTEQMIVLYDADLVKSSLAKQLASAVDSSRGSTLVILAGRAVNQKTPLLAQLAAQGTLVEFTELDLARLRKWIAKEVMRNVEPGIPGPTGIESEAVELLIESYGTDVSALAAEISKLALLTAAGKTISRKTVEQISHRAPETTSFSLVQEMARKNAARASALAANLLDQGLHPLQVSAFLNRAFRTLAVATDAPHAGPLAPELTNPWFAKNLGVPARSFSPADIKASLSLLARLDFQLKDSKLPDHLVLSNTVQRIALRAFGENRQ